MGLWLALRPNSLAGGAAAEAAGAELAVRRWGSRRLWSVPIPPPSLSAELCRELFCSEDVRTQVMPPLNHREEQLPELLKQGLLDAVRACCTSGATSAPHPLSLELCLSLLHLTTPCSPFTSFLLLVCSGLSSSLLTYFSFNLSSSRTCFF